MDTINFFIYATFYFTLAVYTIAQACKGGRLVSLWSSLEKGMRTASAKYEKRGNGKLKQTILSDGKISFYRKVIFIANIISVLIVMFTIYNVYNLFNGGSILSLALDTTLVLTAIACNVAVEVLKTAATCDISSMQYNLHLINHHQQRSNECNLPTIIDHN